MIVLLAGVSGAGKTVVGAALAERLDVPFKDADDLHPAANVAKMRAGVPLDDRDRAPWLDRVAAWIAGADATGGVIACSALKRAARDRLREAAPALRIVLLDPPAAELRRRLATRHHAYMPASLLDSQFAALERPEPDEGVIVIDGLPDVAQACDRIEAALSLR